MLLNNNWVCSMQVAVGVTSAGPCQLTTSLPCCRHSSDCRHAHCTALDLTHHLDLVCRCKYWTISESHRWLSMLGLDSELLF